MTAYVESYADPYDESWDESWDEGDDEAIFRPRAVHTANPRPMPQRPTNQGVTQAQLNAAVTKLQADIKNNGTAIQRVNGTLNTLGKQHARTRRDLADVRKDVSNVKDAVVLIPLLSNVMGDSPLGALLPMMLLSQNSSSSGSGSGGGLFGGDSMSSMFMILALTGSLGKKS